MDLSCHWFFTTPPKNFEDVVTTVCVSDNDWYISPATIEKEKTLLKTDCDKLARQSVLHRVLRKPYVDALTSGEIKIWQNT